MFDFGIGTSELLLIAMVLLIVVGPKELPGLLRTIGQWVGKVKALASEFQGHLDSLAEDSGVKQVKEKVEKDIGDLSIEDLDREFAEIEKEMREQLAQGAQVAGGPKEADDEDLIEEEERPLPKTLDLDAEEQPPDDGKGEDRKDEDGERRNGEAKDAASGADGTPRRQAGRQEEMGAAQPAAGADVTGGTAADAAAADKTGAAADAADDATEGRAAARREKVAAGE